MGEPVADVERTREAALLADLGIDRSVPVAPYYQIREAIRRKIHDGALAPGERLPTVQQIAKACDVCTVTVNRAFSALSREGLLVSRTRAGTVVAESVVPSVELIVPLRRGSYIPPHEFIDDMLAEVDRQFGSGKRRSFLSYVDGDTMSGAEILAVARAKRVDGLLVYRPLGRIADELIAVTHEIPVVTLFYPFPDECTDCVTVDPSEATRAMLGGRIRAGARHFAYVGESTVALSDNTYSAWSPHAAVFDTFKAVMAEAGLEPTIRLMELPDSNGGPALARVMPDLPEDTVLVGRAPDVVAGVEDTLGRRFDTISYTESHGSLTQFGHRMGFIFAPASRCASAGVRLLSERVAAGPGMPVRTAVVEAEVRECRAQGQAL